MIETLSLFLSLALRNGPPDEQQCLHKWIRTNYKLLMNNYGSYSWPCFGWKQLSMRWRAYVRFCFASFLVSAEIHCDGRVVQASMNIPQWIPSIRSKAEVRRFLVGFSMTSRGDDSRRKVYNALENLIRFLSPAISLFELVFFSMNSFLFGCCCFCYCRFFYWNSIVSCTSFSSFWIFIYTHTYIWF